MKKHNQPYMVLLSTFILTLSFFMIAPYGVSVTQATSPITSSGLNTQVSGPIAVGEQTQFDITGGTRPAGGPNLFHSFGDFNVHNNQIANFLNDSGLATSNILARVNGGDPSNIFGTIQTTGFGNANLFLMNPAGILVGPNASVNVGGAVTLTTADYLKLTDGVRFKALATASADALLSAAPVAAFGFLGSNPRAITVQGSQLSVAEGESLSLVGGDIRISRGGTLTAPGGEINLVSVAGRGEARVAPEGIAITGRTPRGHIDIKGGTHPDDVARLDTSGAEGGPVFIRGGRLSMARAEITTGAKEANQTGGAIVIEATKSAKLDSVVLRTVEFLGGDLPANVGGGPVSLKASSVRASNVTIDTSTVNGPGGNVSIRATGNVKLHSSSIVNGLGGNVSIRATGNVKLHSSSISSDTFSGDQDAINIRAATLTLMEGAYIVSTSQGGGSAGNIVIDVGRLTMRTSAPPDLRSRPSISTFAMEASGQGGNINVSASDAILIDGGVISTGLVGVRGGGGSITLSTPRLTLNHLGRISTNSDGARAGDISVNVRTLNMLDGGGIDTGTVGTGGSSAGNINIVASQSISMAGVGEDNRGRQFPSGIEMHAPSSEDRLGRLHVVTPALHLGDGAGVRAISESDADAGSIVLDVGRLDIFRGAKISSFGFGGGGSVPIIINAAKNITLDNGTITTANTSSVGQSGDVSLFAGKSIHLRHGSLISADHTDVGDAGHIMIQAGTSFVSHDSTVSARAEQGNGGTIDVDAKNVTLTNSQLTTSVSGGPQTVGGRITVDAKYLTLKNSQILSTATEGEGGTIQIRSHALHRDARSVIDASSESGKDGTVTIQHTGRLQRD